MEFPCCGKGVPVFWLLTPWVRGKMNLILGWCEFVSPETMLIFLYEKCDYVARNHEISEGHFAN